MKYLTLLLFPGMALALTFPGVKGSFVNNSSVPSKQIEIGVILQCHSGTPRTSCGTKIAFTNPTEEGDFDLPQIQLFSLNPYAEITIQLEVFSPKGKFYSRKFTDAGELAKLMEDLTIVDLPDLQVTTTISDTDLKTIDSWILKDGFLFNALMYQVELYPLGKINELVDHQRFDGGEYYPTKLFTSFNLKDLRSFTVSPVQRHYVFSEKVKVSAVVGIKAQLMTTNNKILFEVEGPFDPTVFEAVEDVKPLLPNLN